MQKSKLKNIFNKKTITIVSVVVLICLVVPLTTHAGVPAQIARAIFGFFATLVLQLISLFVGFGATFLNTMLDIGFSGTYKQIAEAGWKTSRDISNMFFILIMIVIAFGTILRSESFGVKKLLPKLIGVALLINFSLPLCYIFIDISNLAAKSFINGIGGDNSATIRERLLDSVKANILLTPINCGQYDSGSPERTKCDEKNKAIKSLEDDQTWVDVIIASLVACIFLGLSAFTLIAGAMMFVVRLIFLAILVILAPLAFMCYITPSLNRHWKEWWSNLLKWCFFAPIFTFFFWLAITTVDKISIISDSDIGNMAEKPAIESGFMSGFFATMANSVAYFLFIGLIMGGIIAAQKLGITGANMAMGMAKKWQKGATNWAKRTAMRPVTAGGKIAGAGALGLMGKLFGGKIGGRMQAKATQIKQSRAQIKENKEFEKLTNTMTDDNLLNEVKTAGGPRKLIAVQKAQARGLLQKTKDRDAVRTGISTLRGYGFEKEAGDLEEARFSVIKDKNKMKQTIKKVKAKGTDSTLRPEVFKDDIQKGETAGQEAATEFILDEPTVAAVVERVKKLRRDAQQQLGESLARGFIRNNNFQDLNNIKVRWAYAAMTQDLKTAFWDVQNRKIDRDALGQFVKKMEPQNFTGIKVDFMKEIAEFVSAGTAFDASRNLSEDKKRALIDEWKRMVTSGHPKAAEAQKTLDDLEQRPAWRSLII